MTAEKIMWDALGKFKDRQEATNRKPLTSTEENLLVHIVRSDLADYMGQLRDELELAASQPTVEAQRDLDWATDIIISFIRGESRMSVTLNDEKVAKLSAGFTLRVERGEGRTELELSQSND